MVFNCAFARTKIPVFAQVRRASIGHKIRAMNTSGELRGPQPAAAIQAKLRETHLARSPKSNLEPCQQSNAH